MDYTAIVSFMRDGLLALPLWGKAITLLILTHITIVSVTVFLHRHQAHRALDLHPAVGHFFRFWLWLTTGMLTREWVAVHRKHHAKCETQEDPHSPQIVGIRKVLLEGTELYQAEARDAETLSRYGHGTPDDWLERHLYAGFPIHGVGLMLVIDLMLFGLAGIAMWAIQMSWIPFWAAGVINGLGHWLGYRNFETPDASRNIVPVGVLIGGEELHNNHHAFPSSAKFSIRRWEIDLGWVYICAMKWLGLVRIKKIAPRPVLVPGKEMIDIDTVRAVILNRLQVMANYAREVIVPVFRQEALKADASYRRMLKRGRRLLIRERSLMDVGALGCLDSILAQFGNLRIVYLYRQKLQAVWNRSAASHEQLREALQEWCLQAEASGIAALQDFARRLRSYSLQPV
jgi:stearoyl-CoA desaturase (delta-9 desaturase)